MTNIIGLTKTRIQMAGSDFEGKFEQEEYNLYLEDVVEVCQFMFDIAQIHWPHQ